MLGRIILLLAIIQLLVSVPVVMLLRSVEALADPTPILKIEPHSSRGSDALVGNHVMRLERVSIEGDHWEVGCVPCFNALTLLGIHRGTAYALNGSTEERISRFKLIVNSKATRVRSWNDMPNPQSTLLGRAMAVPGCRPASGSVQRTFEAVTAGRCL
jgi:hypothetical protein